MRDERKQLSNELRRARNEAHVARLRVIAAATAVAYWRGQLALLPMDAIEHDDTRRDDTRRK